MVNGGMFRGETERQRFERLRRIPTEEITSEDCAYCQQLRGERRRYRAVMEPCPMHGTIDQVGDQVTVFVG